MSDGIKKVLEACNDADTILEIDSAAPHVDGKDGWIKVALAALDQAGIGTKNVGAIAELIHE